MTTKAASRSEPGEFDVASVSRKPQQGRSKASFGRMLAAAERLMIERGSEDFTLQEVSKTGNVSIGSIYLRFESKENLVRAVIASALEEIERDEDRLIEDVSARSATLAEFVPNYVGAYAEFLSRHAPMLRLSMQRAVHDELVREPGKRSAYRSAAVAIKAMLAHRAEFGGGDHEKRANAAYQIMFATLARGLALGSTGESAIVHDWDELKAELARMCLAYLRHSD